MTSLHIQTALLAHPQLSVSLAKQVWLKMESSQPSGSFKLRGIGLLCQRAVAGGATRLVCPSGGIGVSLEAQVGWKEKFGL